MFAFFYIITAAFFLVVGWYWPKMYSSASTIFVDEQNILRPLMQGTAVTTDVVDRAKLAREIVFSKAIMYKALEDFGWLEGNPSEVEKEKLATSIQERTTIINAGENLIRISYSDKDAMRAYKVTDFFTNEFIDSSIKAKQDESRSAYEFINAQVSEYHEKLKQAEDALKEFRSTNLDASPGSQSTVDTRIIELRRRIETTQLELRELQIQKNTLEKQISGEADVTASLSREGQFTQRIATLNGQLEELRLTYHDTYPDIVQIKNQIAEIERMMEADRNRRETEKASGGQVSLFRADSSLYQRLRRDLSTTETQIATLRARIAETNGLLAKEEQRIIRINEVDARLAELTRDYDVNHEIYNSLLRQRESAYISMNIDAKNQGVTFKIQEPAALQLTPQGIRFAHFLAAGLIMSFAVPLGLIYGLTFVDQKVRSERDVSEKLDLPVLASVYHMNTPTEYNLQMIKKSFLTLLVVVSWVAYGYAAWLRVQGGN